MMEEDVLGCMKISWADIMAGSGNGKLLDLCRCGWQDHCLIGNP
jgi:hypothetical protein